MTDAERVALEVRRRPGERSHELAEHVGMSHRGVRLILPVLEKNNVIVRKGRRWYPA
jgi:hypothetical protein